MKLFQKSSAINPQVVSGPIAATYIVKQDWWQFTYGDTEYLSWGHVFHMPTLSDLELIDSDTLSLMPEMKQRLKKGWDEWGEVKMDDGEKYSVNVTDLREKQEYHLLG